MSRVLGTTLNKFVREKVVSPRKVRGSSTKMVVQSTGLDLLWIGAREKECKLHFSSSKNPLILRLSGLSGQISGLWVFNTVFNTSGMIPGTHPDSHARPQRDANSWRVVRLRLVKVGKIGQSLKRSIAILS